MRKKNYLILLLLFVVILLFLFAGLSLAQQVEQTNPGQNTQIQQQKDSEKIFASFKNIKEETGTYVFLAWMWLSIAVLIWILRLKIKEAERLYHLKFFSPPKK